MRGGRGALLLDVRAEALAPLAALPLRLLAPLVGARRGVPRRCLQDGNQASGRHSGACVFKAPVSSTPFSCPYASPQWARTAAGATFFCLCPALRMDFLGGSGCCHGLRMRSSSARRSWRRLSSASLACGRVHTHTQASAVVSAPS